MAGEAVRFDGAPVTAITGAAPRTNGAFSIQTETAPVTMTAGTDFYTQAEATLTCSYTVQPSGNKAVHLYRRALNVNGTNDEPQPTTTYKHTYVGTFNINAAVGLQYHTLIGIPLTGDDEFYIENDETQQLDTGYTLTITPYTIKPA